LATVTYHHQPGIHASDGHVPLAGDRHLYTVKKVLWPGEVSAVLAGLLLPTSVHVCCGHSQLGDVRVDSDPLTNPDVLGDATNLPFADREFASILCDPPYNGKFQWNHDVLHQLARVASKRVVFQHWFIPANANGWYKKDHTLRLTSVYVWQPKTYFGRAQVISVFDREES
jgi:hypothetical protein